MTNFRALSPTIRLRSSINFFVLNSWSAIIDEFLFLQCLKCNHRWVLLFSPFWNEIINGFLSFQLSKCDHQFLVFSTFKCDHWWILIFSIFGLRSSMNLSVFNRLSAGYFEVLWFQKMVWKVPVRLQSVYLSILSER